MDDYDDNEDMACDGCGGEGCDECDGSGVQTQRIRYQQLSYTRNAHLSVGGEEQ